MRPKKHPSEYGARKRKAGEAQKHPSERSKKEKVGEAQKQPSQNGAKGKKWVRPRNMRLRTEQKGKSGRSAKPSISKAKSPDLPKRAPGEKLRLPAMSHANFLFRPKIITCFYTMVKRLETFTGAMSALWTWSVGVPASRIQPLATHVLRDCSRH